MKALLLSFLLTLILLSSCGDRPQYTLTSKGYELRKGDSIYLGQFSLDVYDGYGELIIGDSVAYKGWWKNGVRQGYGIIRDSIGQEILGLFDADTLVRGEKKLSFGVYKGGLDSLLRPTGQGAYLGQDGSSYQGMWLDGLPNDFGFAFLPSGGLSLGEWEDGKYLGERLSFTEDRIYGIDISKYQHGKGAVYYPIYWKNLRITYLGRKNTKNAQGKVNYPISFIFIKSTEGTTITNPHYLSDYNEARKNGFICGAYHFFSPHSPAIEQAEYFLENTKFSIGDLPPVLDLEPLAWHIKKMGGVFSMFKQIRTWLDIVEKRVGLRPILYVNQKFVNKYLPLAPDLMEKYPIWLARYDEYKPDVNLIFWQLCPDGRVNGIHGEVDINVFNGYKEEFLEFLDSFSLKQK